MSTNKIVVEKEVLEFLEEQAQSIFLNTFPNIKEFTEFMRSHLENKNTELLLEHKADENYAVVSAASILAKVTRDRQMQELDLRFPEYGFKNHKGYGTKEHLIALSNHGPIDGQHRRTFRPIKNL